MAAPRVVVFDAIETLFSLDPLRAADVPDGALDTWFARLLRNAFELTAAGGYAPSRQVAEGALRSVLADHEVPATDELVGALFATFSSTSSVRRCRGAVRAAPANSCGTVWC